MASRRVSDGAPLPRHVETSSARLGMPTVITGAAGDLGKAVARRIIGRGADVVVITDVDATELDQLATVLRADGAQVLALPGDITDEAFVAELFERAGRRFGGLSALFVNAGVAGGSFPLADHPLEDFKRTVEVNLVGTFLTLKHGLPVIAAAENGGSVVITSSGAGLSANERRGAYAASKAGVIQLARACALEYARAGVRVNSVSPGPIEGRLFRSIADASADPAGFVERFASTNAVGRIGTPDEVAALVEYLLYDSPMHLTGVAIPIDGARR